MKWFTAWDQISVSSISLQENQKVPQFIFSSCSGFLLFWSRDKEFKNFLEYSHLRQGRREDVKSVNDSRGPDLKGGQQIRKTKGKLANTKSLSFWTQICRLLGPWNSRALGWPMQPIQRWNEWEGVSQQWLHGARLGSRRPWSKELQLSPSSPKTQVFKF
jgi:hypothetical protein